jgi:hypothetical protein
MNNDTPKRCPRCTNQYPRTPEFFHRDKNTPGGLHSCCKQCTRIEGIEYRRNGPKRRKPLADRFWGKVRVGKAQECWEWTGGRYLAGYGFLPDYPNGKLMAHRLSYEIHFGPISDGLHVLHKCDNPPCVNPNHLFLGTHQDNMADKVAKSRHVFGGRVAQARLSDSQVIEMRKLYKMGWTQTRLAAHFAVSQSLVSDIVRHLVWKHLP